MHPKCLRRIQGRLSSVLLGRRWVGLLSRSVAERVRERLNAMTGPVVLSVPQSDGAMRELSSELAALGGGLLTVEAGEGDALALLDGWGRPAGIRFRGLPQGLELEALVDGILNLSRGSTPLSPLGRVQAAGLPAGTEVWVLTTPS